MNLNPVANSKAKAANIRLGSLAKALLIVITLYRKLLSPYMVSRCRYLPTCSEYTRQAIQRFGVRRGVAMGWRRICRCNDKDCVEVVADPVPLLVPEVVR